MKRVKLILSTFGVLFFFGAVAALSSPTISERPPKVKVNIIEEYIITEHPSMGAYKVCIDGHVFIWMNGSLCQVFEYDPFLKEAVPERCW